MIKQICIAACFLFATIGTVEAHSQCEEKCDCFEKHYVSPENIKIEGDSIYYYDGEDLTPIEGVYVDQDGIYVPKGYIKRAQWSWTCDVCGYEKNTVNDIFCQNCRRHR